MLHNFSFPLNASPAFQVCTISRDQTLLSGNLGGEVREDVSAVLEEFVAGVLHGVGVHAEGALADHIQRQTCREDIFTYTQGVPSSLRDRILLL